MCDFDWLGSLLLTLLISAIAMAIFIVGFRLGYDAWQRDCDSVGLHRSGGVIYECNPRPATK